MSDAARPPAYAERLLDRRDRVGRTLDGRGKFLHLGHFADPDRAETTHAALLDAQVRLNDRILDLADLPPAPSVLDVGCGIGGTLAEIGRLRPEARLTGLNIDPRQIEVARATVPPPDRGEIAWILGDGCALPFAEPAFDRVLAVECIFHFASRRRFLAEAARALHPGGRLVISDLLASGGLPDVPDEAIEATVAEGLGPWPDLWGRDADYTDLAAQAGLVLSRIEDASLATRPSWSCFDNAGASAMDRAVVILGRLHRAGRLRVLYLAFDKPA